jgi:hypothetical protein
VRRERHHPQDFICPHDQVGLPQSPVYDKGYHPGRDRQSSDKHETKTENSHISFHKHQPFRLNCKSWASTSLCQRETNERM